MKKNALSICLLVGAALVFATSCQSKKAPVSPAETPVQPYCQPDSSGSCEKECREDECDYEEAGEEAMIHVIEVDDAEDGSSAAATDSTPAPAAVVESPTALEVAPSLI